MRCNSAAPAPGSVVRQVAQVGKHGRRARGDVASTGLALPGQNKRDCGGGHQRSPDGQPEILLKAEECRLPVAAAPMSSSPRLAPEKFRGGRHLVNQADSGSGS
jgi:hypothetical protein